MSPASVKAARRRKVWCCVLKLMMAAAGCQKQCGQADVLLQNRGGGENTKESSLLLYK